MRYLISLLFIFLLVGKTIEAQDLTHDKNGNYNPHGYQENAAVKAAKESYDRASKGVQGNNSSNSTSSSSSSSGSPAGHKSHLQKKIERYDKKEKVADTSVTLKEKASIKAIEFRTTLGLIKGFVTEDTLMYLPVVDNGKNRNIDAEYYCQWIYYDYPKVKKIKIIKIDSENDSKKSDPYGIILGESNCK